MVEWVDSFISLTPKIIEIIAILIMFCGLYWYYKNRRTAGENANSRTRGIGMRGTQFITVVFLFPVILIIALEGILNSESICVILGAIIGYVLYGLGIE